MHWPAVVGALLASFMVGGLWYSPALFMKRWMAMSGVDPERFNAQLPRALAGDLFASTAIALGLAFLQEKTGMEALELAPLVWLCFMAPVQLTSVTYEHRPFGFFLINTGYRLVSLLAMGAVLTYWR